MGLGPWQEGFAPRWLRAWTLITAVQTVSSTSHSTLDPSKQCIAGGASRPATNSWVPGTDPEGAGGGDESRGGARTGSREEIAWDALEYGLVVPEVEFPGSRTAVTLGKEPNLLYF